MFSRLKQKVQQEQSIPTQTNQQFNLNDEEKKSTNNQVQQRFYLKIIKNDEIF